MAGNGGNGGNGRHAIAWWAAVAAFASNVVAIKVVDVLTTQEVFRFIGVLAASLFVGGAVYARERVEEARMTRLERARTEHWVRVDEEDPPAEPPA